MFTLQTLTNVPLELTSVVRLLYVQITVAHTNACVNPTSLEMEEPAQVLY